MKKLSPDEVKECFAIKAAIKASGRSQAFIGNVVYSGTNLSANDRKNRINRICNGKRRPTVRLWVVLDMFGIYVERRVK